MSQVQKQSQVTVVVDAALTDVWCVVSDVTRVGEWSHECHAARWVGDVEEAVEGARFRGRNRAGWARWGRTCEIVSADAPRELAWRTVPTALFPDSTRWCIRLADIGGGRTRITQTFEVLRAPWLLDRVYARLIPAHRDRDARLARDLVRIGEVARRGVANP